MTLDEQIKQAFSSLVEQENGNLRQVAIKHGTAYPIIHKLFTGKSSFAKMSVQTLAKLFPRLRISFFGEDPTGITVNGNNSGAIANGTNARAFSLGNHSERLGIGDPKRMIDREVLEIDILESETFTPEERVKILLFLKNREG